MNAFDNTATGHNTRAQVSYIPPRNSRSPAYLDGPICFSEIRGHLKRCVSVASGDESGTSDLLPMANTIEWMIMSGGGYPKAMATLQAGKRLETPISKSQGLYYHYDYGSNKELSLFPLEYSMEDAYGLPRIVGAVGHTPPEAFGTAVTPTFPTLLRKPFAAQHAASFHPVRRCALRNAGA